MGYCISMEIHALTIKAKGEALKAINALHKDQKTIKKNGAGGFSSGGGKPTTYSYAWVDDAPEGGFKSLEDAFSAWRYKASTPDGGDCVVEYFEGEKLGDDHILWQALAKYINPKAEIACRGEDGALWKWVFNGSVFKELVGTVSYH